MTNNPLEIGAAYIRVSTDEQTELSPDAQLRVILDEAKKDGVIIPPEFIYMEDRGRSGRRADNRPEFQRMIAVARQNPSPFKHLYVWKFSRFARNQEESTFYKGILRKKCGVTIKSVSEPIMEGMFGRLIETIIEWFDEFYSVNLSGEVIRGMTEKALRQGYQTTPSLGYDSVGDGKPFVINEEQYKIVEFIHQAFYEGKDLTEIARECNARGYRTRRGNTFELRSVKLVLSNSFYVGLVRWKDIVFQGPHECRESVTGIFAANQQRLQKEYRPKGRREVSSCSHWLSGILKCSTCGASLGFNRSNGKPGRVDFFHCWKYGKGLHEGSCSITRKKAEAAVLRSLQMILSSNEVAFTYSQPVSRISDHKRNLLVFALERLETKELRIREAYEGGIDTLEEFKQNKLRLQKERKQLLDKMKEFEKEPDPDPGAGKDELLKRIRTVYDLLQADDVPYEVKGKAIRRILKTIEYDGRTKTMQFHYYV